MKLYKAAGLLALAAVWQPAHASLLTNGNRLVGVEYRLRW